MNTFRKFYPCARSITACTARLHELRAEIRVLEGKFEARIKEVQAAIETKFAEKFAEMGKKLAEMEAKLVRWVFLVMLGNVALSVGANALVNALKNG